MLGGEGIVVGLVWSGVVVLVEGQEEGGQDPGLPQRDIKGFRV